MKRIPDLTDAEFQTLAQALDVYVKNGGLNVIEPAYTILKVLMRSEDVPDKDAKEDSITV